MRHFHRIILAVLFVSLPYVSAITSTRENSDMFSGEYSSFQESEFSHEITRPAFIPNRGQVSNSDVQYSILLPKAKLHFTRFGLVMHIASSENQVLESTGMATQRSTAPEMASLSLRFSGSRGASRIDAIGKNDDVYHFYTATAPEGITDIASYNELYYHDVYRQIDARFRITDEGLKYEFIVHPGGDPDDIRMRWTGVQELLPLQDGRLQILHTAGSIEDAAPVSSAGSTSIVTSYKTSGTGYGFELEPYDRTQTLVIDPCLMWASFYGGGTSDISSDVATDAGGFIIFTGFTSSIDFPVANAVQGTSAGSIDAYIVKVDGDGKRIWSTYYGGSGSEDWPRVATDPNNSILVGGYTSSLDFPTSPSAYQRENGGKIDAFILKLTSQGKREWATLFGGSFAEECGDIVADGAGGIYITGNTFSTNLPVTESAELTSNQGDFDAFVAKFDSDGGLLWSTYLGGWSLDYGTGLAISPSGTLAVTGYTESSNFPVSSGAMQSDHNGGRYDAFLVQYNTNGRRMWSTYYGGSDEDQGMGVAYGMNGMLYFTGHTKSNDLETDGDGQNSFGGSHDAFIGSLSADGSPRWLSYFGGKGGEQATDITVDAKNTVYVCGFKIGDDLPGASGGFDYDTPNSMDAFLAKLDSEGNRLWSTSYGGPLGDIAYGVALDEKGNIIMIGETGSKGFPVSGSPIQKTLAGYEDGFLMKILFYEPLVEAGDDGASCAEQGIILESKVSQGVPPYAYSWSPTQGLDDPTSKSPRAIPDVTTTYTLTVTDSYGCIGSDTVTVVVNERPTVDPGPNREMCPGTSLALMANVSGGSGPYTFEWTPAQGLNAVNIADPEASPQSTTTYIVRVTDAKGCTHKDSVTIKVLPPPIAIAGQDKVVCLGSPTQIGGEATGGTPPYSYKWNRAGDLDDAIVAMPMASPRKDANFIVTVTDSKGCTDMDTVFVKVLPSLTISAGKDRTICYGASTAVGGEPNGGKAPYTYTWSPVEGVEDPQSNTTRIAPLTTTTYTLTVTDASGCVTTDNVTITVRDRLIAQAGDDQKICAGNGVNIGGQNAGGTPPYDYKWQPSAGLSSASAATPTASPGKTTNYILTVTDNAGCTATDTVTISVLETPKPQLMKDRAICQGEQVNIEATVKGGRQPYAFNWDPPFGLSGANVLAPTAQPSQTVTYVLTVTDANGCMGSDSITLTVHPVPQLSAGKKISICRGATAEIGSEARGGKGPYKYKWTPETEVASPSKGVTKVRPKNTTTYQVTVTDANGCSATTTYTVEVLDCPSGDAGNDAELCLGSGSELGGSTTGGRPPYSYEWLPASGLSDPTGATPLARPTSTTAYEMTVTDANGCKFRDSVTVTVFQPPQVTAGEDKTICYGAGTDLKAEVKGGEKPFEYFWTPADQLEINNREMFSPSPLATTLYVVTVKDANGCSATDSVRVIVAPPLAVQATPDVIICKGEDTKLLADIEGGQPPFSFEWSGVATEDAKKKSVSVSPDKTTRYYVTVTDAAGCEASDTVNVTVEDVERPIILAEGSNPACDGDTLRLQVKQQYASYSWSTGATERSIIMTESGTVTVTGANERGCNAESKALEVIFNQRPDPKISLKGDATFCEGNKVVLSVSKRYKQYAWSTGEKDRNITVTTTGSYSVTVTDSKGCSGTSEKVEITVHPAPTASITQQGDSLIANEAASYQWQRNKRNIRGAISREYVPTRSGSYRVSIKNENGCEAVSDQIQFKYKKK